MFATSTSKGAGKCNADCNRESSNLEQTPGKRLCKTARAEKATKLNEEGSSKGLIDVLDKQIKLLLEAQERDDKMMEIDTVRRDTQRKAKGDFNDNN